MMMMASGHLMHMVVMLLYARCTMVMVQALLSRSIDHALLLVDGSLGCLVRLGVLGHEVELGSLALQVAAWATAAGSSRARGGTSTCPGASSRMIAVHHLA